MTTSVAPGTVGIKRGAEARSIGLVSTAHCVAHFHALVLPVLFPFLKKSFGIDFIQLGLALTVYSAVSVAAQLPMGYVCDRFGSRRVLVAGLLLSGTAFIRLGLAPTFPHLLVAAALLGLANSTYHPADYAILSSRIPPIRIGRAFAIHTFAGYAGNTAAPVLMVPLAAFAGLRIALIAAGMIALTVSLPLVLARHLDVAAPQRVPAAPSRRRTVRLQPGHHRADRFFRAADPVVERAHQLFGGGAAGGPTERRCWWPIWR
jgi:MFS family permease